MNQTKQSANIPILSDIIERGEQAPTADQIMPMENHAPPPPVTDSHHEAPPARSTSAISELDDIEDSDPAPDYLLDKDALVEEVLQTLKPHLEELARETLHEIIRTYRSQKKPK